MQFIHYQSPSELIGEDTFERLQLEHHILFQRRKELHLTQQKVADKAGIQLRQYQRLESGERYISGSSGRIMLSVCEALKLDPYLFLNKGNQKPEVKYVTLPPVEKESFKYVIPTIAYYTLVSAIPRGMVCTDDELMACLRNAYGIDSLEIKRDYNSIVMYADNCFPYWRVVSQRGYLINSFYSSKESQKTKLEAEDVNIVSVGENESYRIDEFEYRRFDVNLFKITVMKTTKQIMEQYHMDSFED